MHILASFISSHKAHLTSKLNYRRFPYFFLYTFLSFPFHLLPSPVHHTEFSSYFIPGFLTISTLLSPKNSNNFYIAMKKVENKVKLHYLCIYTSYICNEVKLPGMPVSQKFTPPATGVADTTDYLGLPFWPCAQFSSNAFSFKAFSSNPFRPILLG